MRTVKEVAAAVTQIIRDVAQHATVLGTHRAELNELKTELHDSTEGLWYQIGALKAEIAELRERMPAVRTPGQRVTEPCSPIDDDGRATCYPLRDKMGRPYRVAQINGRSVRCFAPEA